jgi:hypothetical protein
LHSNKQVENELKFKPKFIKKTSNTPTRFSFQFSDARQNPKDFEIPQSYCPKSSSWPIGYFLSDISHLRPPAPEWFSPIVFRKQIFADFSWPCKSLEQKDQILFSYAVTFFFKFFFKFIKKKKKRKPNSFIFN